MRDCGNHGGADAGRGASAEFGTLKSLAKCFGLRQRGGRSRGGNQRFFDVDQVGNEKTQKMLKMKSAPNELLKTKAKKCCKMQHPNEYLKTNDLSKNGDYFMKTNEIERFYGLKNRKNPQSFPQPE